MREFAKDFYKSSKWKDVRGYCMIRDSYLCRICGKPAAEVHHIVHLSPENINDPSIALNPDNLISVCRSCHFEQHRGEHAKGREKQEENEYTFDENGMLIKKDSMPPLEPKS